MVSFHWKKGDFRIDLQQKRIKKAFCIIEKKSGENK